MNRRELLTTITAGVTAAGVKGATVTDIAQPAEKPALIVLQVPGQLTNDEATNLSVSIKEALADGPFHDVKVLVLQCAMSIKFLDKAGAELLPKEVLEV